MTDRELSTFDLMKRWDCTRQNVSQIMKRYGKKKMYRTGYSSVSLFSIDDVHDVESQRCDECRP